MDCSFAPAYSENGKINVISDVSYRKTVVQRRMKGRVKICSKLRTQGWSRSPNGKYSTCGTQELERVENPKVILPGQ
jgi:hypothetical protein